MKTQHNQLIEAQKKRLLAMKSLESSYTVKIADKEIIVLPKVFYPGRDSILMVETVPYKTNDVVLDTCSGTGIFAIFAANMAKKVIAIDTSEFAVKNIQENIKHHKLQDKVTAIRGNIFPGFEIKFDKIVINPPYTDNFAEDVVDRSVWDQDHKTVIYFLINAKKYLAQSGKIYLSWANFADFDFIEEQMTKYGYKYTILSESPASERMYRIYELTF